MLSGVLCCLQNVVWRLLLQNIFQFLVQFLWLVVFLVQFEAENGIQCNAKFAFGICGRIESILKVHYIHYLQSVEDLFCSKVSSALVKLCLKQPVNQQGSIAQYLDLMKKQIQI